MRIASIFLPVNDNNGVSLATQHTALQAWLCDTFGGFTAIPAKGGYRFNDDRVIVEDVTRYDVAVSGTAGDNTLHAAARYLCSECSQECVMFIASTGEVEFAYAYGANDAAPLYSSLDIT